MDDIIKEITHDIYEELSFLHLESVYQRAFGLELQIRNIRNLQETNLNIKYKGLNVGFCRLDMVVIDEKNNKYIIEFKAINKITKKERNQILKYLQQSPITTAYLINFGLKQEILKFEKDNNKINVNQII